MNSKTYKFRGATTLGLILFFGGCSAPTVNAPSVQEPLSAQPTKAELDPSYTQLDPAFTYYNVAEIDELRDHYTVVFSDAERSYCTLGMATDDAEITGGCGFPAESLNADAVPSDKQNAIPALKAEVLKRAPNARNINVKFEGTYRRVILEEFRACDFQSKGLVHGHDFSRVILRFDEALTQVSQVDFQTGSNCGAMFCYWCETTPKWVPLRTNEPILGLPSQSSPTLSATNELLAAVGRVVREPNQKWSLPTDTLEDKAD